jgi:hypothetical protein
MRDLDDCFAALSRSSFRARFRLDAREAAYLHTRGLEEILRHAREFIDQRLAPAHPANDGRQTPFRNHPAFVAQHATGTCCRKCLAKWHRIPMARELTTQEREYVVRVIARWLKGQL